MIGILTILILFRLTFTNSYKEEYDFIIIGGGASGTIASIELAKKYPDSSVLLIERGLSDLDVPNTHSLTGWPRLLVDDDIIENIRYENGVWTSLAKVLSGGAALNAGIMGKETDQFFEKTFGFNKEQIKSLNEVYENLYNEIGHKTLLSDIGQDLINAAEEIGLKNTGYQHGYVKQNSTFQTYSAFDMSGGFRNTTSDYVRKSISSGEVKNLRIKVKTQANRLLISNDNKIWGVSVLENGEPKIYYVKCSVILSSGVIKSTQLLQVSGIGDKTELESAGIPNVIDLPYVGKNFIDRIVESSAQFSALKKPIAETPISSISVEDGYLEERTAGGTVSSSFAIISGAVLPPKDRTEINMRLLKDFIDSDKKVRDCMDNAVQINILVANPTSRGYIKPQNPNINDPPIIDPNFLDTEEDKIASEYAKKKVAQYFATNSLKKWSRISDDETKECGVGNHFPKLMSSLRTSSYHLFGGLTHKIVLNDDFTVKGINNLYVVDASIFPRATEINPFNTISALGGFISKEFVKCPENKPVASKRVQIQNSADKTSCLALEKPIYAEECHRLNNNSLLLIQDLTNGRYTTEVKKDIPYFLRSGSDDSLCIHHIIGGLTGQKPCDKNTKGQYVYFVPIKGKNTFKIKFNLDGDTAPCILKWWGSNTISGFSCTFPEEKRLEWIINVID